MPDSDMVVVSVSARQMDADVVTVDSGRGTPEARKARLLAVKKELLALIGYAGWRQMVESEYHLLEAERARDRGYAR